MPRASGSRGEAGGEIPEGEGQLRSSGRQLFSFWGCAARSGYFFLLITIYHTWLGISRGDRDAAMCGTCGTREDLHCRDAEKSKQAKIKIAHRKVAATDSEATSKAGGLKTAATTSTFRRAGGTPVLLRRRRTKSTITNSCASKTGPAASPAHMLK